MDRIKLKDAVRFSNSRISYSDLKCETYISTDNLLQNKQGFTATEKLPASMLNTPRYFEGNILVSNIRPYLKKIYYAKQEGGVSSDVLTFVVNKDFNSKYIFYNLLQDKFFDHMMAGSKGTKMPRGDKNQILDFELLNYDIQTQKKIASVLSALDDKIELNNKINIELAQMAKTLYDYWFVQFDFPNEEGKPYKSSGGEMVYNDVLKREIPIGWEVKSLYQIANFINGLACQKFRPESESDDYLPVIKIREMNDGISKNTEKVKVDIPEKNIIKDGDVLFSWSATLDVKIWTEGNAGLNQHIFKVTSEKYPRSFYYFQTLNYLQHFKMMAELRKTTMGHITKDHLMKSYIPIPPMQIINTLDEKLNPILEKIISNKKQNQELATLRDWLLPMLMNGQVSVGESEGEVLSLVAEERREYKKN